MATPSHPQSRRCFLRRLSALGMTASAARCFSLPTLASTSPEARPRTPVVAFPGPWQFQMPKGAIILVSDQQLQDLADPDREVDLSLSGTPNWSTLRKLCAQQQAAGARTIILAFDEFWSQYRAGQGGKPRQLTPDTDDYISLVAKISETVKAHGLGLELSLLSPLEIGAGYAKQTAESGRWVHFREGWRDPQTGFYAVSLWEQLRWTNNKGTIELKRDHIRVFAFRERRIGRTAFYTVAPEDIVELKTAPQIEAAPPAKGKHRRITVLGRGDADLGPKDRVLVVLSYAIPEMDYFSPRALPFLEDLVRRYHSAGIPLNGLYADEMHIQQDWGYADHHEEGQFAVRYLTSNLAKKFASLYGNEYQDLERWLVYFTYAQHSFLPDLQARLPAQHVIGDSPDDIHRTFLLRRRYYELLHETVVDLFAQAKHTAERLYGHELEARAHATWAQSPTIDFWNVRNQPMAPRQYDYTPDFLWSNTVQQAASACSDYFKWNDFLTGGGNDHAEGGWSDRNYYGLALACSTGSLNRVPNAYAAAWGMPAAALERHRALENAFGCSPDPAFAAVCDFAHREIPVLMLYPASMVACEERFGSWMVQYGYANYVTPTKLVELSRIVAGGFELAGRQYRTLVVLFEPLPPADLLPRLEEFVRGGGTLIWSGPPPRCDLAGNAVLDRWQRLLGVKSLAFTHEGLIAAGSRVEFDGSLQKVEPQPILTDFLVDLIYPVQPEADAQTVARVADKTIGVLRRHTPLGQTLYLGFRPRDDQAASLGSEVRAWFDILRQIGAYAGDDDPSVVSRTTPFLATRFPNTAIALAAHYRHHVENWPGGFHRDPERDEAILKANPLPSDRLTLDNLWVDSHRITYEGRLAAAFRLDASQRLAAFAGYDADRIQIDGKEHRFADRPLAFIAWAPVAAVRRMPTGALLEVWVQGAARCRVPLTVAAAGARLFAAGSKPGDVASVCVARIHEGGLEFEAAPGKTQGHLYLLPA